MNATEERRIKSALDRLVEQTPELGPTPNEMFVRQSKHTQRWAPLTAVAAAAVAVAGLGFIVATRDTGSTTPAAPASQPNQTEPLPEPAQIEPADIAVLVPQTLPAGYTLYVDDGVTSPDQIEGRSDRIFGPPDAQPNQIVEVAAGTDIAGVPCGATTDAFTITEVPTFCPRGFPAEKQLNWTINGTSVVIWAGSAVVDEMLLELAAGVSIEPGAAGGWLDDSELIISPLPDPNWVRLGHDGPEPLISESYTIGSVDDPAAPTFLVDVFTNTAGSDLWSIMYSRHRSELFDVRGTTGYLDDTDELNPFLVWQEAPGVIVRIQNNGGTADSILAFAESLTPINSAGLDAFRTTAATPPTPPPSRTDGAASTIPEGQG